jgi:excisionase family DNA binding protein
MRPTTFRASAIRNQRPRSGPLRKEKPTRKIMNAVVSSQSIAAPASAFTLPQVARMLSVSRRTLERQHAKGRLKFVRIGRCVRVKPEDLAAYTSGLPSAS